MSAITWNLSFQNLIRKMFDLISSIPLSIKSNIYNFLYQPRLFHITDDHHTLYELHVTVQATKNVNDFESFCQRYVPRTLKIISCKAILIELPVGIHKQQPMCSIYFIGTFGQARQVCSDFAAQCETELNMKAIREKIEMRFDKVPDCIPIVNGLSIDSPLNKNIYWEFHVKLFFAGTLNDGEKSLQVINDFREALIKRFGAYVNLSRSARSTRIKYQQYSMSRIVTIRIKNGSKESARMTVNCVQDFLNYFQNQYNYIVDTTEKELSIYDNNIGLDQGWV